MHSYFLLLFVTVFLTFFINYYHFLNLLLSFEFLMLMNFMMMVFFLSNTKELYILFIFLSLSTCESILGLTIFVIYIRYFSKDYLKFLLMMML